MEISVGMTRKISVFGQQISVLYQLYFVFSISPLVSLVKIQLQVLIQLRICASGTHDCPDLNYRPFDFESNVLTAATFDPISRSLH